MRLYLLYIFALVNFTFLIEKSVYSFTITITSNSFLLLKYSWCTILYYFQVYNIVVQHLNTLWNDHHNKSSSHLSPYKVITVLLTLYCIIQTCNLFCNWNFVPLNPLHLFSLNSLPLILSPLANTSLFSVFMSLFLFFLNSFSLFFKFQCKLNHNIFLSPSDLFHIVKYPLGPSMVSQMARYHSDWWLSNILLYVYTTSSLSIHMWIDT